MKGCMVRFFAISIIVLLQCRLELSLGHGRRCPGASGSRHHFLSGLTRFLCINLCKKVVPILFFYSIKFRGYAHYANARINLLAAALGMFLKTYFLTFT